MIFAGICAESPSAFILYADGINYCRTVKSLESVIELINKDLELLSRWYAENKMNLAKTKNVIFLYSPECYFPIFSCHCDFNTNHKCH